MIKLTVIYDNDGRIKYSREFERACNQYFRLRYNVVDPQLQQVIDWCIKNCIDFVFLDEFKHKTDENLERYNTEFEREHVKNKTDDAYDGIGYDNPPTFRFEQETDMMAFKLKWQDLITQVRHKHMEKIRFNNSRGLDQEFENAKDYYYDFNIGYVDLPPIIKWCNENLENFGFLTIKSPGFRLYFAEESDMMLFKFQWPDLINEKWPKVIIKSRND